MTQEPATFERRPAFIERNGRRLFMIHYRPCGGTTGDSPESGRPIAIIFPPFAEEMNRCRRMMTLQAEALATAGTGVIVFDYSSTGDSDGEFADARWERWVDDGHAMLDTALDLGATAIYPIAIRLGAAVALTVARDRQAEIDRMVLWQPVSSGALHMTQFLRLRIAAALTGEKTGETTRSLRQRLVEGEILEVGGYALSGSLTTEIESIRLESFSPQFPVTWLETMSQEPVAISPASERVIDLWREQGADVDAAVISGEPYWSIQETTVAPALLQATTGILVAR